MAVEEQSADFVHGATYRVTAVNLFFTYQNVHNYAPASLVVLQQLVDFIQSVVHPKVIREYSLCAETYPTRPNSPNEYHIHFACALSAKVTKLINLFKFNGIPCQSQCVRPGRQSLENIFTYCNKDQDSNGLFIKYWEHKESNKDAWAGTVLACKTRIEANAKIMELQPAKYILNYNNVQSFLTGHFTGSNEGYNPSIDWEYEVPVDVQDWKEEHLDNYLCDNIVSRRSPNPAPQPL